MPYKNLVPSWVIVVAMVGLFSPPLAIAGEVGTTPDGNVIYRFFCPAAGQHAEIHFPSIDWDNHLKNSDGLEWDIDHGISGFPFSPKIRPVRMVRSGQVLTCTVEAKWGSYTTQVNYRYKVNRDIIACKFYQSTFQLECILKPHSGGGQAGSSATVEPEKAGEAPPLSPTVAQPLAECCHMTANLQLKGRLGRLVVTFPEPAALKGTSVVVLKDGKQIESAYGSQAMELLPGTYEVQISGKSVSNITVQSGHDTNVKVGVLHVEAAKGTPLKVLDAGKVLISRYGSQLIGLPIGSFEVKVGKLIQSVTISEGQTTDF